MASKDEPRSIDSLATVTSHWQLATLERTMADQAKVLSVQALKDFRVSLINFVEEARNALAASTWNCSGCATGWSAISSRTGRCR